MNKTQRKQLARTRREDQKARRLEKQRLVSEETEAEELETEQEGEEILEAELHDDETLEKDMGMEYGNAYASATSWDELEQERAMQEQAQQVRETTWDVQDLVRNILMHPMMGADEKSAAIQEVGSGFGERVKAIMGGQMEEAEKSLDMELLEVRAILAYDTRHTGAIEKATDWIAKKKLSYSAEQNLSDEDFALVMMRDGKKVRKYPVQDKAHVRNALARAAQQMMAGGQGAADAKAALPKIRAMAKKMGIEVSTEKERNAILVEKDLHGDWRWVGWVSNNFIDWDGDIISDAAHREFVEWLDKNSDAAPEFLTWHTAGTKRESAVDFWNYEHGFLIMSGKLTEHEAAGLLKAKALTDLGMSHGTWVLSRDENDPRVITKYRMYEVSDLPLENAANPFTDFEVLVKEVDMDKEKYLAELVGKDKAALFMKKTGLKTEALTQAGVTSKAKQEETPPETPPSAATTVVANPPATANIPLEEIVERVSKELDIEGLSEAFATMQEAVEKVPVLEALVKDLSKSRDEQLTEMLTPPVGRFAWSQGKRASQSNDTVVEKNDKLAKQKPEGGWLSEITGVEPVATPQ